MPGGNVPLLSLSLALCMAVQNSVTKRDIRHTNAPCRRCLRWLRRAMISGSIRSCTSVRSITFSTDVASSIVISAFDSAATHTDSAASQLDKQTDQFVAVCLSVWVSACPSAWVFAWAPAYVPALVVASLPLARCSRCAFGSSLRSCA